MSIQTRINNNNEPFVLDDTAEVIDGITLAASQGDLSGGYAVLGEVTATPGTYKVCDYAAEDGSQIPKLILATRGIIDDASPQTGLSAYTRGLFDENQLIFGGSTDLTSRLNSELMPNQVDRDFSGASAWENVDLNAFDETDDLTITATAADQYCTLPVASFPTKIGEDYIMKYDLANIVESWTIQDFSGTQTIGTIAANATQGQIAWKALTTGGIRIVAAANTSSGDFDNFSLIRAGNLADLTIEDLMRMFALRLAPGISETGYENA
jgi:hypothetical protein